MKRIDKTIFKDKSSTNLLANAAKMKISKAKANANAKLQQVPAVKLVNTIDSGGGNRNVCRNKFDEHLTTSTGLDLKEKPARTPIFHFVASLPATYDSKQQQQQQQQQHSYEHLETAAGDDDDNVDEQVQTSSSNNGTYSQTSLAHNNNTQTQVNCVKGTTTGALTLNERMLVKVENISTTQTLPSLLTATEREKVDLEKSTVHEVHNTYDRTLPEPVLVLPSSISVLDKQSKQTVLRSVQTATQTLAKNSSTISLLQHNNKVNNFINDFQTEHNRVNEIFEHNNLLQQQQQQQQQDEQVQQQLKDKNTNNDELDKTHLITTTTTTTSDSVTTNSLLNEHNISENNAISDKTSVRNSSDSNCVAETANNNNNNIVKKEEVVKTNDQQNIEQINNNNSNVQEQQLGREILPINYRGENNSVIIANYSNSNQQQQQQHQQRSITTTALIYEEQRQQQQQEQQQDQQPTVVTATEEYLHRYEQQQQQHDLNNVENAKEQQQHHHHHNQLQLLNNNNRGDPNLNQTSLEQQQQYLLNAYNSCVYDLSLHHQLQQQQHAQQQIEHLQQQQQQQLSSYASHSLHLQPLAQSLHIFEENNNNNNNSTDQQRINQHNNINNNQTNMSGNLTLFASYGTNPHEHHSHAHHLQTTVAHTPTSIDEVIQDTLKDECLDDHNGGLSYCTLTAVADLPALKENYYNQLAVQEHLAQQQQQQHHQTHQHHHLNHHHQQQQQHQQPQQQHHHHHHQQQQPLLQQHLQALNHHNHATAGSDGESSPHSVLVHHNMGVDMAGHSEMVTLQSLTQLTNASNAHRDPYGNLTPDHTPNLYYGTSLSPGLPSK